VRWSGFCTEARANGREGAVSGEVVLSWSDGEVSSCDVFARRREAHSFPTSRQFVSHLSSKNRFCLCESMPFRCRDLTSGKFRVLGISLVREKSVAL